jgi:predicted phage-related endonuclease
MSEIVEQRSAEWFAQRAGKWTGSKFVDVLARNKKTGEPLKAYTDLIWQVVVERMTGQPVEGAQGFALQWGKDVEPFAREAYELETGMIVTESEFIVHPQFDFVGCSPDGLIGNSKGLEMKCPKSSAVHLERYISGVPEEYIPQIQGCMWVTDLPEWDFVSYDPRMPESHRLIIIPVKRDEEFIAKLQSAVLEAEVKAQELLATILRKAA